MAKKRQNKRLILALTGIRSDYDILYPILVAIRKHPRLAVELVVSGGHLSAWHQNSVDYVAKDGFKITEKIDNLLSNNSDAARAKGLGILTTSLVQTIERVRPDFLLAIGDREEPMAAAIAANYMKIPMAHVAGGDSAYGNADDPIRHAVSKLAHLHFTTAKAHKERLIKMGEEPSKIFWVGNPALDRIRTTPRLNRKKLSSLLKFDINHEPFIIVLQHSFSLEANRAYRQMKTTMEAVKKSGLKAIVIYPNTDPGGMEIIRAINEYGHLPQIKIFKNLERLAFVNLLREAACLVGNSSCGFLEASFLKLPVINIGERQKGRINTGNIILVKHDESAIANCIRKVALNEQFRKNLIAQTKNIYGQGRTGVKIAKILADHKINRDLLLKKLTY